MFESKTVYSSQISAEQIEEKYYYFDGGWISSLTNEIVW